MPSHAVHEARRRGQVTDRGSFVRRPKRMVQVRSIRYRVRDKGTAWSWLGLSEDEEEDADNNGEDTDGDGPGM